MTEGTVTDDKIGVGAANVSIALSACMSPAPEILSSTGSVHIDCSRLEYGFYLIRSHPCASELLTA